MKENNTDKCERRNKERTKNHEIVAGFRIKSETRGKKLRGYHTGLR